MAWYKINNFPYPKKIPYANCKLSYTEPNYMAMYRIQHLNVVLYCVLFPSRNRYLSDTLRTLEVLLQLEF